MMKIKIYTDGACSGNGKETAVGGWGWMGILEDGSYESESGYEHGSTNQRMEITAIIEACEWAKIVGGDFFSCDIYTDSAYCQRCYEEKWYELWQRNGWKTSSRTPVKNAELWERLIPYFEDIRFNFHKVRGHSGDEYNEIVDKIARNAVEKGKNTRR